MNPPHKHFLSVFRFTSLIVSVSFFLTGCGGGGTDSTADRQNSALAVNEVPIVGQKISYPSDGPTTGITIEGGTPSSVPWLVQLRLKGPNGGTATCSGALITAQWVLTAQHCPSGATVRFMDGTEIVSQRDIAIEGRDIRLVRLAQPKPLSVYPEMNFSYQPRAGDQGVIYGVGVPNIGEFRKAQVNVTGASTDAQGGRAVRVTGQEGNGYGYARPGDSGGPLIINGYLVGVLSTGLKPNANYANIADSARTIFTTLEYVGKPTLSNGRMSFDIGILPGVRTMVWRNGSYAAEVYGSATYYLESKDSSVGKTVSLQNVNAGDRIQIGIVPGTPGMRPPSPTAPSVIRLRDEVLDAIRGVKLVGNQVQVEMSPELFASRQRVMFILNGRYIGETYNGGAYYADGTRTPTSVILKTQPQVKDGDEFAVYMVDGEPGWGWQLDPMRITARFLVAGVSSGSNTK